MASENHSKTNVLLLWLMFQANENLLFMLCGVFISVCINLITTVFTSEYKGGATILFIISTLASACATVAFSLLTLQRVSLKEEYESIPNFKVEQTRNIKKGSLYQENKKRLIAILFVILASTLIFIVALIIGWCMLNGWILFEKQLATNVNDNLLKTMGPTNAVMASPSPIPK